MLLPVLAWRGLISATMISPPQLVSSAQIGNFIRALPTLFGINQQGLKQPLADNTKQTLFIFESIPNCW